MLQIGSVQLDVPVVQAALAGYSDAPMRLIARRQGAPYALHEVVLDKVVLEPGKSGRQLFDIADEDRPIGGQLMGADPARLAEAAWRIADSGFDVVELNFACPVRKVLGRCRGGFLLSDPSTAIEIIRGVRAAVPPQVPVTLKMRRGTDDSPASERSFFRVFDGACEHGLAAVTVHGRTIAQRYVGPSDWGFLARVKRHAGDKTVLGSGDLFSAEACVRMIGETGVDGVTIARGCVGNPWIFEECRALWRGEPLPPPPSIARQREAIEGHWADVVKIYGEVRGAKIMRKFGIKYARQHPHAVEVRDAFVAVKNTDDVRRVLDAWYDPAVDWPPVIRREDENDLTAAGATT